MTASNILKRDQPCSEDCGRLIGRRGAKGLCARCYQRAKHADRKANPRPCVVSGCIGLVTRAGLSVCDMHQSRKRRSGEYGPAGPLMEKRGEWHTNKAGYRIQMINGREVLEHRAVMEEHLGRPLWPDEEVHHKNLRRADNWIGNLELWATSQPPGARVEDLVTFYVGRYPELAEQALRRVKRRLRKAG